jgi:hypothetical protein
MSDDDDVDFHEDDFEYDYWSGSLSIPISTILLQAGMGLKSIPIVTQ